MHYAYRAVDPSGKVMSGSREVGSERELADALRREGVLLLDAESSEAKKKGGILTRLPNFFQGVSLVERMTFARNLAVMVGAGLALTRALEALEEQSPNQRLKKTLAAVRSSIASGNSFADGLRQFENIFGRLFINMIESGEVSGNLERVLKLLAQQMKRDHDLRSKVRSAMIYPAIIVVVLVLIGTLMMIFVVPTLTQTFTELGINLPITTRIVIGSSNFLLHYYWIVLLALIALVAGLWYVMRIPRAERVFDDLLLRMPIIGGLDQKLNSARFARTLASLIASGVSITKALEITASVLGNSHFQDALADAAQAITQGKTLSDTLKEYPRLFPPLVTEMLKVGEETGTTSAMLLRLALFYEEEVSAITKNLSSVIEPILMVVIGGVVGFFAVSMIQPIYSGLGNL